jgi:glycosyltransferase involved in cell wall biosynthesis
MITLNIAGWRGPWGWIPSFEDWGRDKFSLESINHADKILIADLFGWRQLNGFIPNKKFSSILLDLADWHTGAPSDESLQFINELYSLPLCNRLTISTDVQNKLAKIDIQSSVIHYPSQVSKVDLTSRFPAKTNTFVIFCRLGDPGKRVQAAIEAFRLSKLEKRGWRLFLCGPEPPQLTEKLPLGVIYLRYLDKESLFHVVKIAAWCIQPSIGEGLGLPSIESALLFTPSIYRTTVPTKQIFKDVELALNGVNVFTADEELHTAMINCADVFEKEKEKYIFATDIAREIANPWIREIAFASLWEKI